MRRKGGKYEKDPKTGELTRVEFTRTPAEVAAEAAADKKAKASKAKTNSNSEAK